MSGLNLKTNQKIFLNDSTLGIWEAQKVWKTNLWILCVIMFHNFYTFTIANKY